MFAERPLGRKEVRETLKSFLEKNDMRKAVFDFMPRQLGGDSHGKEDRVLLEAFRHLWFGSYVSSVIDSSRTTILVDELCSQNGFDMHFKIIYDSEEDVLGGDENHHIGAQNYPQMHRAGIKLHFHCVCYFDETQFLMDLPRENEMMQHTTDLTWRWVVMGRALQVGPYPPLVVSRLENWGWKLENQHVVLYTHG